MPAPPLLRSRPIALQILLVPGVAIAFGLITGLLAGADALYIVLNLLAAIGGVLGGIEHDARGEAAVRGAIGGAAFGLGVIAGVALGDPSSDLVPDPTAVLLFFTIPIGAGLASLGAGLRPRFEAG